MSERPVLAITMGDPSGIGPEVTVKALAGGELHAICRPLVIGDLAVMQAAAGATGVGVELRAVADAQRAAYSTGSIDVLDLANVARDTWRWGALSGDSGRAAMGYVFKAMELVDTGAAAGIVTAQINKEATSLTSSKELRYMRPYGRLHGEASTSTVT